MPAALVELHEEGTIKDRYKVERRTELASIMESAHAKTRKEQQKPTCCKATWQLQLLTASLLYRPSHWSWSRDTSARPLVLVDKLLSLFGSPLHATPPWCWSGVTGSIYNRFAGTRSTTIDTQKRHALKKDLYLNQSISESFVLAKQHW